MRFLCMTLLSFGITSCMHTGMTGVGHGTHPGRPHEVVEERILQKEIIARDVKAIAVFPPLEYGKDLALTLTLADVETSAPISGAQVYFSAQGIHGTPQSDIEQNDHVHTSDQLVVESAVAGVYTIPYGTSLPGEYALVFRVTAIGERELEPEMRVEVTRVLSRENIGKHGGMMGVMGDSPFLVVGGALMGAMIVSMVVGHRGIF